MTRPHRRTFLRTAAVAGTGGALVALGHAAGQSQPAVRSPDDFITPETQSAITRGLEHLANCQAQDGSFGDRGNSGNVAVTALAGLALLSGGHHPGRGKYGRVVSRAADYVISRGRASSPAGYLQNTADLAGHGSMYQHGFGALFLSEVHGTFPDPDKQAKARQMLEKAISVTVKAQNKNGGWRYEPKPTNDDVSVTVAQLMALRAAKNAGVYIDKGVIDKTVEYIRACQLPDGGFCYIKGQGGAGSLFPRSAAAVVGLYSAGIYDGPAIEKGLKYLMRYVPTGQRAVGFDVRPEHYYYGQYYAALAMWTAGGNYWAEWFPAIRNELLLRREANGVWNDYFGSAYATAMACIILQLPNNYLPIMQK
jgi:hypothetical protein